MLMLSVFLTDWFTSEVVYTDALWPFSPLMSYAFATREVLVIMHTVPLPVLNATRSLSRAALFAAVGSSVDILCTWEFTGTLLNSWART